MCRTMDTHLRKKVEDIIGEIIEISLLENQGCTSEVRKIVTDGETYLLKSSFSERYRNWLKQEAKVLKRLENKHIIPVPKYYGYIEEEKSSHVIMSFEKGIPLTLALENSNSIDEKKLLIKSFGQLLQQLHQSQIIDSLITTENWLDYQLARAEKYLNSGDTDGTLELLNKLKTSIPKSVKQTMIHGDCTTDNVIVKDGKVQMFIDVSGMTVGDPRYDESLAIRSFKNNEEFIKAFYSGYTRYMVSNDEFLFFDKGLYEFF